MIVRILRAHVGGPDAGLVVVAMREALAELHAQPGMEYAKLARRLVDGGEEIILVEEWAAPADLYRWTGGDLRQPRLDSRAVSLLRDLTITHYESLDRTPVEMGLDLIEPMPDSDAGAPGSDAGAAPGSHTSAAPG